MNHEYDFKFGYVETRDVCAVLTSDEGVHIDTNQTKEVWSKLEEIFGEKKFGFIANRINSYSVNPLAVVNMVSHENLVAGAIVSQTNLREF